uniref:Uncharacterized protein n=1 Tax=Globisporangium ultimum (strain ATCC 200006 / CBS 805.95 / DAOM BR144) TaxID=431595 RepID=K3WS61_GLOUD
ESARVEELVGRERHRITHTHGSTVNVRARTQVRVLAQVFERMALLGHRSSTLSALTSITWPLAGLLTTVPTTAKLAPTPPDSRAASKPSVDSRVITTCTLAKHEPVGATVFAGAGT